jgi:hypothetical protein
MILKRGDPVPRGAKVFVVEFYQTTTYRTRVAAASEAEAEAFIRDRWDEGDDFFAADSGLDEQMNTREESEAR